MRATQPSRNPDLPTVDKNVPAAAALSVSEPHTQSKEERENAIDLFQTHMLKAGGMARTDHLMISQADNFRRPMSLDAQARYINERFAKVTVICPLPGQANRPS